MIVYVSSSFVQDSPVGFGGYVAVKQSGEALVRTVARENTRLSCLIARPPMLQTRMNDTPAGIARAIPSGTAALHIVKRIAGAQKPGDVQLLTEFPILSVADPAEGKTVKSSASFAIR